MTSTPVNLDYNKFPKNLQEIKQALSYDQTNAE